MTIEPLYDAPGIDLAPGYLRRLDRWVGQARARVERGAWSGPTRGRAGEGEFEGFRPYRPGEDVRGLDWNLYARMGRPYVRLQRAESGARWCVLLDTGAGMGLGRPGKLQFAGESALALAAAGAAQGARVELVTRAADGARLASAFSGPADLGRWIELLQSLRAPVGSRTDWEGLAPTRGGLERLFVLGDLASEHPRRWLAWAAPGRRIDLVHVLAPHELDPALVPAGSATFVDRAHGQRVASTLSARALAGYAERLALRLERLRGFARGRGVAFHVVSSAAEFEDAVRSWIGT